MQTETGGLMVKLMGACAAQGARSAALAMGISEEEISIRPYSVAGLVWFQIAHTTQDAFYQAVRLGQRSCFPTC